MRPMGRERGGLRTSVQELRETTSLWSMLIAAGGAPDNAPAVERLGALSGAPVRKEGVWTEIFSTSSASTTQGKRHSPLGQMSPVEYEKT